MESSTFPIRISTLREEGLLQVSKWLKVQVLLNKEEMQELIHALEPIYFVVVSEPVKKKDALISSAAFIQKYAEYMQMLEEGHVPMVDAFRKFFSCAMALHLEDFYAIALSDEKVLIKPKKPVVQLQAHHFFYSYLDKKFHPMVLSPDSICWGLQFSYPQLYQDPKTRQILKIAQTNTFSNTDLFSKLMKWMRNSTLATPFKVEGKRVNAPFRVGRKVIDWIPHHPQLKRNNIEVFI